MLFDGIIFFLFRYYLIVIFVDFVNVIFNFSVVFFMIVIFVKGSKNFGVLCFVEDIKIGVFCFLIGVIVIVIFFLVVLVGFL